jgi:hypothetical protein
VDPVPDPLLFFLVVPGIEPGPPDLTTLTTRPQRSVKLNKVCTGSETLTVVAVLSSMFCDVTPCSPLRRSDISDGIYRFLLQGLIIRRTRS